MSKPESTSPRTAADYLDDDDHTELWDESSWLDPDEDDDSDDSRWDEEDDDYGAESWNARWMVDRPSAGRSQRRHGHRHRNWERFKRTIDYQEAWYDDRPRSRRPTRR